MKVFVFALLTLSVMAQSSEKYQCLRNILNLGPVGEKRDIAVKGSYDIKTMLTLIDNMPEYVQKKVKACDLNLEGAKNRCLKSYGEGKCEKITDAAWQTKCDKYFKRVGCCHCAMSCPEGWTEDDYHCIKPDYKETKLYKTMEECSKAEKNCEQRGAQWSAVCGHNFRRMGSDKCVPICPFGWHDEGKRCRKPADYRMAQPFLWQQGDN